MVLAWIEPLVSGSSRRTSKKLGSVVTSFTVAPHRGKAKLVRTTVSLPRMPGLSFAPLGLLRSSSAVPQLALWAAFFRRFAVGGCVSRARNRTYTPSTSTRPSEDLWVVEAGVFAVGRVSGFAAAEVSGGDRLAVALVC